MELKTILYDECILKKSRMEYQHWKRLKKELEKNKVQCINIKEMDKQTEEIIWEDVLVLAGNDTQIQMAEEKHAAVLGIQIKEIGIKISEFVPFILEGFEEIGYEYLNRIYRRKHRLPWTILETKRCIVREMTVDDLDALYALYSLPQMTEFIEPLYDRAMEKEYIEAYCLTIYRYYEYGIWVILEKNSGRLIGRAGFEEKTKKGESKIEMGYMIATDYQRQGYAKEVCQGLLEYARKQDYFQEVFCNISKENTASIALAESLRFERTGICTGEKGEMIEFRLKF